MRIVDCKDINLKIMYCGPATGNSWSRYKAIEEYATVSYFFNTLDLNSFYKRSIAYVERRIGNGPLCFYKNKSLVKAALKFKPDVCWIEMGKDIYPSTLKEIKEKTGAILINTYSDDFLDKITKKYSKLYNKSIPYYDIIFTPREVNFDEYYAFGAKRVEKFWKGFTQGHIKPYSLTKEEEDLYKCDVVFAGHNEEPRFDAMVAAARTGANVKVWGGYWEKVVWPKDVGNLYKGNLPYAIYPKALSASKIAIGFVSRWARDSQNSRLFEIPATGTFMLFERTVDSIKCYEEGVEAEFFSTIEEMSDKIKYYLKHEDSRQKIAVAGYKRAVAHYSNANRIQQMLSIIDKTVNQKIMLQKAV